jgi:DNA-binding transcriptional MerR regulator
MAELRLLELLGITNKSLRDWERNGLDLCTAEFQRIQKYGLKEMNGLKIIRTLRTLTIL